MTKTNNEFVKQLKSLYGSEYLSWERYVHGNKPMKFMHFVEGCKRIFYKQPELILRGQGCPCLKEKRKAEKYKRRLFEKFGDEYQLISEYTLETDRVTLLHNIEECMKTYTPIARDFFRRDQLCPYCNETNQSKGELKIYNALSDLGVSFKEQFTFKDCKDKGTLRFDFAVFDEDENLEFLIEFDGGQHFKPVEHFGGEEGFLKQQKRDQIKNDYCREKKIKLIRIPYWEENNLDVIINNLINGTKLDVNNETFLLESE